MSRPTLPATHGDAWTTLIDPTSSIEACSTSAHRLGLEGHLADRHHVRALVDAIVHGPDAPNRVALVTVLGRVRLHPKRWAEVRRGLLRVALDPANSPQVRGEALDALGVRAPFPHDEETVRRVVRLLDDPEPEVQFWACYLIGVFRWRAAEPALRRLAETSTATLPGWWSIAAEARDSLDLIARRDPPERRPGAPNDGLSDRADWEVFDPSATQ